MIGVGSMKVQKRRRVEAEKNVTVHGKWNRLHHEPQTLDDQVAILASKAAWCNISRLVSERGAALPDSMRVKSYHFVCLVVAVCKQHCNYMSDLLRLPESGRNPENDTIPCR